MQYEQIIDGYYEGGEVKAIDMLNLKPLTKDYFKSRPDMKQRVEKAINTQTYLAAYQRGTRLGWKFITKEEVNEHINTTITVSKKSSYNSSTPPKDFYIDNLKWKFLVRNIEKGKNIMMTGPSGCGKTDATFKAAEALGREVMYFNLGATQDPRSTLIGNTHYNKDSGTYFSESSFVSAIQKENAVILLDELSRAHPEAWNILMTVLDPIQRYLRLDEKDDSPTIKVADGVSFIATANIGMEYTATRVIDRAILVRFALIEMEPLSEENEFTLLKGKFPSIDDKVLNNLCSIVSSIRKEINSDTPRLSTMVSTRNTIEIAELLDDGFSLEDASQLLIYPLFPNDGNDSERVFVKQLIQKFVQAESKKQLFDITELDDELDVTLFGPAGS
jgi:midasin (ATPase involved in ribosome maturation)